MSMVKVLARFVPIVLEKLKMSDEIAEIISKEDDDHKNNQCQTAIELSEFLKSSLRNILNNVSQEKFISIYKTCYKEFEKKDDIDKPALSGSSNEGKKYHFQFNEIITRTASRAIEETVSDMNSNLKELEELKLEQSDCKIQWRPPGNVSQHMLPFEFVSEMERKKELEGKIEREQETLGILKARVNKKRCKARELHEELLTLIEEIKCIVSNKVKNEKSF